MNSYCMHAESSSSKQLCLFVMPFVDTSHSIAPNDNKSGNEIYSTLPNELEMRSQRWRWWLGLVKFHDFADSVKSAKFGFFREIPWNFMFVWNCNDFSQNDLSSSNRYKHFLMNNCRIKRMNALFGFLSEECHIKSLENWPKNCTSISRKWLNGFGHFRLHSIPLSFR